MMGSTKGLTSKQGFEVEIGDIFSFVTYINGIPTELTGNVVVMMGSAKARALGLTKSKRRRLYLGFRTEGQEKLIWKDRGQAKFICKGFVDEEEEDQNEVVEKER